MEEIKEMLKTIINLAVANNKAENSKGEDMDLDKKSEEEKKVKEINNEDVDKRKLLREADAIAMKPSSEFKGGEEEKFRTLTKLMEKIGYNKSEAGTANNSVVNNESEEDREKVKELKEDMKKDVNNSKTDYFAKMNEVYNASQQAKEETIYVSRADRLKAGEEMFSVKQ